MNEKIENVFVIQEIPLECFDNSESFIYSKLKLFINKAKNPHKVRQQ